MCEVLGWGLCTPNQTSRLVKQIMSDADRERLTLPPGHCIFPPPSASGSYTGTTFTSNSAAPPFAPRPHYNQSHHHSRHGHGTAPSSRSGGTSTHTDHVPPSATSSSSTTECNCHEVCYYFQQAIFILAIMTGIALIIAGAIIHVQSGELLVFVYIGVLLASVNTVLLMIQCCVRRKQKRRSRAYQTARQQLPPSAANQPLPQQSSSGAVRYKTLVSEKNRAMQTGLSVGAADTQPFHYKHYHLHSPNLAQSAFQEFPVIPQDIFAQSPTESAQTKFVHGPPYHRSGSIVSHHRHAKALYQKSPPLGQLHRPLLNTLGPQLPRTEIGTQEGYSPTAPPPSYDDILRTGRLPTDSTIVHLI